MSVGGKVVDVAVYAGRVWIATQEREHPNDRPTAIYVERTSKSECVEVGDTVWWQGRFAYWTPRCGGPADRKLIRIGYSGVTRPDVNALVSPVLRGLEGE